MCQICIKSLKFPIGNGMAMFGHNNVWASGRGKDCEMGNIYFILIYIMIPTYWTTYFEPKAFKPSPRFNLPNVFILYTWLCTRLGIIANYQCPVTD